MWLEISEQYAGSKVHHRDIVGVALRRMRGDLGSPERDEVVRDIHEELTHHKEHDEQTAEMKKVPFDDASGEAPSEDSADEASTNAST